MNFVILPAYNEEDSLHPLLNKISEAMSRLDSDYTIIVCNDGSKDKTGEILDEYSAKLPIKVVTHKINRGLGETSRDLFEMAGELSQDNDIIIRMDCDDTHEPKYISSMIDKVNEGYDVVIASRFQKGGGQEGVNAYRSFISFCANIFMKLFFYTKGVQDYSCGFRAYRASIIKKALNIYGNNFIQLKGLGFTCTLEKLIKLKNIGARFAEVPFVLRYDQKVSNSKMVSSITTMGYMLMVILNYWPSTGWKYLVKKD